MALPEPIPVPEPPTESVAVCEASAVCDPLSDIRLLPVPKPDPVTEPVAGNGDAETAGDAEPLLLPPPLTEARGEVAPEGLSASENVGKVDALALPPAPSLEALPKAALPVMAKVALSKPLPVPPPLRDAAPPEGLGEALPVPQAPDTEILAAPDTDSAIVAVAPLRSEGVATGALPLPAGELVAAG